MRSIRLRKSRRKTSLIDRDYCNDDMGILKMYREVLENHHLTPEVFDERKEYSEMDYIIYFWGPLLKGLFAKTNTWPHWGDTESENCKYKFRMDLRFLCSSLNNSPDHDSGEFARNLTAAKYYSDKKKLVLNGIIQLDNILNSYHHDPKEVKIPLFQALAHSADLRVSIAFGCLLAGVWEGRLANPMLL